MRFDHEMPGDGVEVYVHLENGKVTLEAQVFLAEEAGNSGKNEAAMSNGQNLRLQLLLFDPGGELVLECHQYLPQEELCRSILLSPRLWRSVSEPFLYQMEMWLWESGRRVDRVRRQLPLRKLCMIPGKGWQLNGESFELRAVPYCLPPRINAGKSRREIMERELQQLRQMGANTLWVREEVWDLEFCSLCERMGFILYYPGKVSPFGGTGREGREQIGADHWESLRLEEGILPDRYYFYRACWTKDPFIHICTESLRRQPNGCYEIMVYSNCRKVALYVDGSLFEFQNAPPEFFFQEIPGGKEDLILCAEGEGCSASVTIPASFASSSVS